MTATSCIFASTFDLARHHPAILSVTLDVMSKRLLCCPVILSFGDKRTGKVAEGRQRTTSNK